MEINDPIDEIIFQDENLDNQNIDEVFPLGRKQNILRK